MKIVAKPVKMIASFDENGTTTPLKFKMAEQDSEYRVVKVDKIISTETIKPAGMDSIVFLCQSEVLGLMKRYELIYRIKSHQWELYKI